MGPIKIFYSYAQEDEELLQELEKHLDGMKRSKLITTWSDRLLEPGIDWKQEAKERLESADMILLLVSDHFLHSDSYSGFAMKRALERYNAGEVSVIPILLSPVNWEATAFKHLPTLPTGGKAVIEWQERDAAFLNIAEGIREVVTTINISSLAKDKLATGGQGQQTEDMTFKGPPATSEGNHSSLTSKESAKLLELRKARSHSTVLLLGARAGGLFRSERFYDTLQPFSQHDFSRLSRVEQFRSCYALLTKDQFSEVDVHIMLREAIRDLAVISADICLAELVKRGYFDEIITTNIDDILEQALSQVGLREYRDFEMVIASSTGHLPLHTERSLPVRITKTLGDLSIRDYNIKGEQFIDNQELKNFLQRTLARDILIIGADPLWDEEMLRVIPESAGTIWFVNEEDPGVSMVLQDRHTNFISGREGSYEQFITALYNHLIGDTLNPQLLNEIHQQLRALQGQFEHLRNEIKELKSENEYLRNLIKSNNGNPPHTQHEY